MFRFPGEIPGWLTEREGLALALHAQHKKVLEIGSFKGRSTACLAQTAESVTCVDPFDGRATPEPGDTFEAFLANTEPWRDKIKVCAGTIDAVGEGLPADFDLVFIDGAHDHASVRNDTEWALRLLKPGGLVAYHDYRWGTNHQGVDPGVEQAVNDLLADGGKVLSRDDSLVLIKPPTDLVTGIVTAPRVVMGMPCSGAIRRQRSAIAFFERATNSNLWTSKFTMDSSVLTLGFNRLWAEALNARDQYGATHFVMLHDDVCPVDDWFVDRLLAEITAHDADVVSCVIPMKCPEGITSTALGWGEGGSPFRPLRRLTMHEAMRLPETFTAKDVHSAGIEGPPTLFINTGCWIADLRRPWVTKNVFRNVERLVKLPTGKWKADCVSEDWAFSCDLARWGAKVMATRKVRLFHENRAFNNHTAWGSWESDEEYFKRTGQADESAA